MNSEVTQTIFLYTSTPAKGRLNVPTALGHMLMPSARVEQTIGAVGEPPWSTRCHTN